MINNLYKFQHYQMVLVPGSTVTTWIPPRDVTTTTTPPIQTGIAHGSYAGAPLSTERSIPTSNTTFQAVVSTGIYLPPVWNFLTHEYEGGVSGTTTVTIAITSWTEVTGGGVPITTTTTIPGHYETQVTNPSYRYVNDYNLGWTGTAQSSTTQSGDCTATFSIKDSTVGAVVGLNEAANSLGVNYAEISHGLYFRYGNVSIIENGLANPLKIPFVTSDVFTIVRIGATVYYCQNSNFIYTSTIPSYGAVDVDAFLYASGDEIDNADFSAGNYFLISPQQTLIATSNIYSAQNLYSTGQLLQSSAKIKVNDYTLSGTLYSSGETLTAIGSLGITVAYSQPQNLSAIASLAERQSSLRLSLLATETLKLNIVYSEHQTLPATSILSGYGYPISTGIDADPLGYQYMPSMSGSSLFPALTQQGTAFLSSVVGQSTFQPLTSIGYCGAIGSSTLKALTSTGAGTGNQLINGASLFPSLKSSGTASVMMSAFGSSTFKALTSNGASGAIGASTFKPLTSNGTATIYFTLSGASLFPALSSKGTGVFRPTLSGGSLFPALASPNMAQGASIFPSLTSFGVSLSVANNSVAYVLNIHTGESTTYSNMNFMHIIPIGGKDYGVRGDGLYLLEGDTDNGAAINGHIKLKDSDFGSFHSKGCQYVYLDSDTQTKVTPYCDGVKKTGQLSSFRGRKCQLGQGNRSRFWMLEIENIKQLSGIEIIPTELQRRVK